MQKKKSDNLLDKIVKKDYNNELEEVLEKKYFDENVKSLLLSMLYKIENAYKDYEKVKQNIESKEDYINNIINIIKNDCDSIKTVKPFSEESKIIGNRTFLVEKSKKRIICYPIERKLLYSIAKIGKQNKIIKNDYFLINETLSDLINVGNSINTVEPLRDFNGYSWTTIPKEIESLEYNLVYQNLRILLGYKFLENWIKNKEFIIDYMDLYKNKLEEKYGRDKQKKITELVNKISVLLDIKYNNKLKTKVKKQRIEIGEQLEKIQDKEEFIVETTEKKKKITEKIRIIDETINNKELLQKEYTKRNEKLPLEKKIFSIRILSQKMSEEREELIKELEECNNILNPKKFVKYKKELEQKMQYLNIEEDVKNLIIELQKVFLECYKINIKKSETKQEILKLIYEYRYYNLLIFDEDTTIYEIKEIQKKLKEVENILIEKAQEMKLIIKIIGNQELDNQILRNIFNIRIINLEELNIKIMKEKDKYYLQLFDEDIFEKKVEISNMGNMNKKDLQIKINRKVKIFN